jgi:hypothetical protein
MQIRKLISIIKENEELAANPQAGQVDQLIKDIKAGEIAPSVVQAVSNYIQKKLAQKQSADTAQKEPQQPTTTDEPEVQPEIIDDPDLDSEEEKELAEAVQLAMPPGVTLKPDELRKFLLKGGFKSEEVNDIVTFAYRQTIELACRELASVKLYKTEAADMLAQLFFQIPGTLSQRNHIAKVLTTTGVLDLNKLTQPGIGTLDDLIMTQYRTNPIVINLKLKLKNRSDFPTQVSSASKGAGEDLITILGNPVNKLSPGDLNIAGKEIEIKGMGARLKGFSGPDVYGDAARIYKEWANVMIQALGPLGLEVLNSAGANLKKYLHFSLGNLNALNDAVQVSKVPQRGKLIRQAFELLLETLYVQSDSKMREIILRSFDSKTGMFDVEELRKNWFLFSYEYYKLTTADKKTGEQMHAIMFMNQGDESYQIVTDRQQLEDNLDNYTLGTDLFNWTNPTGMAPKITLGKEVRVQRKRAPRSTASTERKKR